MSELRGACIIAQSGGPTAVINASALGVIRTALDSDCITRVLGAAYGIKGVLEDKLYDMGQEDPGELELLRSTPASVLGSCRYKLADPEGDDTDYRRILEIFQRYDVRYFFYNGGNDSMDTCNKISRYMQAQGYECRIIGVPKTIDNDLNGTDHCPGYGSAAKYIATSCAEVWHDAHVYDTGTIWPGSPAAAPTCSICRRSTLIWIGSFMTSRRSTGGRASVWWPRPRGSTTPTAVMCPRRRSPPPTGSGMSSWAAWPPVWPTSSSCTPAQRCGARLAHIIKLHTGAKVRGIELSLLQRCSTHIASQTDIDEAYLAGKAAVEAAVAGNTGKMVAFRCTREGGYRCETTLEPLDIVANLEKKVPRGWINAAGNGVEQPFVEQPFLDYALPLIQGQADYRLENSLPRFAHLKKVLATR